MIRAGGGSNLDAMARFPTSDGRFLNVRVLGRGEPVVMLAGMGMPSALWLPYVAPFAHRYRFYMPDFRGFGASVDVPMRDPDVFESNTRDLVDLLEHFRIRDHRLVGYSLGASTSLHYLRSHGFSNVRSYLHIDQSPFVGSNDGWSHGLCGERQSAIARTLGAVRPLLDAHPAAEYLGELPLATRAEVSALLTELFLLLGKVDTKPGAFRAFTGLPKPIARHLPLTRLSDLRTVVGSYGKGGHDYRDTLRFCDTPITVFIGMRSQLYASAGQETIAALAPNARVVRFERSGHVPLVDEPRKFVRELGRFLAG